MVVTFLICGMFAVTVFMLWGVPGFPGWKWKFMRDHCKLSFPLPPRSRVLARLTSLTQIGELARRLINYLSNERTYTSAPKRFLIIPYRLRNTHGYKIEHKYVYFIFFQVSFLEFWLFPYNPLHKSLRNATLWDVLIFNKHLLRWVWDACGQTFNFCRLQFPHESE